MRKIVMIDDEPITRMDIGAMLTELGFQIAGEGGDGFDAIELCRRNSPDVVLMDIKMPVFDGLSAAEEILREELVGCVVLLTAFSDQEMIERAKRAGVTGYLVKPVEQRMLLPTIEMAMEQSDRLRRSREETAQARRQLEETKLVQRAQAVLARREGLTEAQAHQRLRRLSMDKRMPIAALAQALIDQERRTDDVAFVKERLMQERKLSELEAFRRIVDYSKEHGCGREEAARRMREALMK